MAGAGIVDLAAQHVNSRVEQCGVKVVGRSLADIAVQFFHDMSDLLVMLEGKAAKEGLQPGHGNRGANAVAGNVTHGDGQDAIG